MSLTALFSTTTVQYWQVFPVVYGVPAVSSQCCHSTHFSARCFEDFTAGMLTRVKARSLEAKAKATAFKAKTKIRAARKMMQCLTC